MNGAVARTNKWYVVGLLSTIAILSYLDRYILALLAGPVSKSLGISYAQIGLLIGLGFALLYSVAGVPIAHALDRGRRVRIVGAGVTIWSLSTIASGFATRFDVLLLSRGGVAIGEAVLLPAAVSLIADLFPKNRRTLPTALFMGVVTLMGSGAFVLGGLAFDAASALSTMVGLESWRLTLILVGAPGLFFALLWVTTVAEPPREQSIASADAVTMRAAIRHLRRHFGFYGVLNIGFGLSALGSYAFFTWTATILTNSYRLSTSEAGYYYGLVGVFAGLAAAVIWPVCSAVLTRRGRPDANVMLLALANGLAHVTLITARYDDTLLSFLLAVFIATFGFAAAGTLAVLAIQAVTPSHMRAKMIATYMLIGNVIGLSFGPALCAWLAAHFYAGDDALRQSLSLMGMVLAPVSVLLIGGSVIGYRRAQREESAVPHC